MLESISCEDYGFKMPDLIMAATVKSYLRLMKTKDAKGILNNIVSSYKPEYKLDGMELARLIQMRCLCHREQRSKKYAVTKGNNI